MATPRLPGCVWVTSASPMCTAPLVGCSSPASVRSSVVFPQPDGPSSAKNSPSSTVTFSASSAVTPPAASAKVFVRSTVRICAMYQPPAIYEVPAIDEPLLTLDPAVEPETVAMTDEQVE